MAVVTSSNDKKMEAVYRAKPEIKSMFDRILTAEMFTASKPAPEDVYKRQVYVLIALVILLLIVACVIWKSWRIANENPVNSIKSE